MKALLRVFYLTGRTLAVPALVAALLTIACPGAGRCQTNVTVTGPVSVVPGFHFVGASEATPPGLGPAQMNYACAIFNDVEYGLTARMCTVKEFYDTVFTLAGSKALLSFPKEMWAAPSLEGCYYSDSQHLTQCSEVGSASLVNPVPTAVSCSGWTSGSSSQHGTVVKHMDAEGSLTWNYQTSSAKCSSSLPVACCAP